MLSEHCSHRLLISVQLLDHGESNTGFAIGCSVRLDMQQPNVLALFVGLTLVQPPSCLCPPPQLNGVVVALLLARYNVFLGCVAVQFVA